MMKKLFRIGFFSFFIIFSCSKKDGNASKNNLSTKVNLPNFGNVDVDNVFKEKEPQFANRTKIITDLEKYYQNIWDNTDMSGGVLVASGDEILLEKYKGFARENKQIPINAETPLHLASISKPITAMAILKLVEAKKLHLDQNVNTILKKFPYPEITILHLLNHRSGLSKYEHYIEEAKIKPKKNYFTNQEVLDIFIKNKPKLARETDSGFMYNNLNYALLASIIENITKMPYPEAMQEMVFKPLKMKNTFVFEEKHIATASQSFYQKSSRLYPLNEYDLIYGDKNIYTTPRDLFNFSKAMFSENFLSKELMDKVFAPYSNEKKGVNNYGLGFRLKVFDNEKKLTYHNGWWHGSNTVFIHLRKSKTTIIALSNKYSRKIYGTMLLSTLFEDFPFELEKILNAEEGSDANSILGELPEKRKSKKTKKEENQEEAVISESIENTIENEINTEK